METRCGQCEHCQDWEYPPNSGEGYRVCGLEQRQLSRTEEGAGRPVWCPEKEEG